MTQVRVEPGHDRQSARHRRGGVAALFLHPPHVQLDVLPGRRQRVHGPFGTPDQEGPQVGLGVRPGLPLEPGQVRGGRQPQWIETDWWQDTAFGLNSHAPTIRANAPAIQDRRNAQQGAGRGIVGRSCADSGS
jgi:hypothetical protein